ncbi:type 1 glutamine amidotransferase [Peribacillus butanolivorans]|uniref:type 1 glutamine amidotransferase n=1 Tax=Peribacillus butanolivorans TaxID=421767 RepID=UPI0035DAB8E3
MKIHILQHEVPEFGGPGVIKQWAEEKGHAISITRVDLKESYPSLCEFDLLVILGGLPGVNEEEEYPWLKEEKVWIRSVIDNKKHVLGICLGAQLIADSMGGKVDKHIMKEIGWWPVEFDKEGQSHPLLKGLPKEATFYQVHQDTFTIPPTGTHLAESKACKNQAFSIGDRVLALQFHPEVTMENAEYIVEKLNHVFKEEAPFIQTPEQLLRESNFQDSQVYMYQILSNFESQILSKHLPNFHLEVK